MKVWNGQITLNEELAGQGYPLAACNELSVHNDTTETLVSSCGACIGRVSAAVMLLTAWRHK